MKTSLRGSPGARHSPAGLPRQAASAAVGSDASGHANAVPPVLEREGKRLQPGAAVGIVVVSLVLQIILPLYVRWAGLLDLLLLVVVYLALLRRNVIDRLVKRRRDRPGAGRL